MMAMPNPAERRALLAEGLRQAYPLGAPDNLGLLMNIHRAEQRLSHCALGTGNHCETGPP